eukprot:3260316-Rhodomonas_salina.1
MRGLGTDEETNKDMWVLGADVETDKDVWVLGADGQSTDMWVRAALTASGVGADALRGNLQEDGGPRPGEGLPRRAQEGDRRYRFCLLGCAVRALGGHVGGRP